MCEQRQSQYTTGILWRDVTCMSCARGLTNCFRAFCWYHISSPNFNRNNMPAERTPHIINIILFLFIFVCVCGKSQDSWQYACGCDERQPTVIDCTIKLSKVINIGWETLPTGFDVHQIVSVIVAIIHRSLQLRRFVVTTVAVVAIEVRQAGNIMLRGDTMRSGFGIDFVWWRLRINRNRNDANSLRLRLMFFKSIFVESQ